MNPWLSDRGLAAWAAMPRIEFRLHETGPVFVLSADYGKFTARPVEDPLAGCTLDESMAVPMLRDRAAAWLVKKGCVVEHARYTIVDGPRDYRLSVDLDYDAALIEAIMTVAGKGGPA